MIETKILDTAVGIQRQDVIDKSETTPLPSLANGVITGHFKRGRMDKPFKVTASNYKALLGHDPSNPSYLAVEDAFKNGVSEISVLRTGGYIGKVVAPPLIVSPAPDGAVISASGWYIDSHSIIGKSVTINALKPPLQELAL